MKILILLGLALTQSLGAATIAVIDSGVDYSHPFLRHSMWADGQGHFGRNFLEGNNEVFDPADLLTFSPDLRKLMDINAKVMVYAAGPEERSWAKERTKDSAFMAEMTRFQVFNHGTHVAGIVKKDWPHRVMAVKFITTAGNYSLNIPEGTTEPLTQEDQDKLLLSLLTDVAQENINSMKEIASYVGREGAVVANASFGTGVGQAPAIVGPAFELSHKRKPTQDEISNWSSKLINLCLEGNARAFADVPQTLFVFAAGNYGLSNDKYPMTPANVREANTITVAATDHDLILAPFSNYGVKTVDIAAPGVNILSSIPGGTFVAVSGTSQAAPFVSNVAGRVFDTNPTLTATEVKQILMGTVDKKEFLKNRVASEGVVNSERAILAAELSKTMTLDEAIDEARLNKKRAP